MTTTVFQWKVWKIRTILGDIGEDPVEVEHRSLQGGLYLRRHQQRQIPAARMSYWEVLVEDHRLV
jgi:hypothetical protein